MKELFFNVGKMMPVLETFERTIFFLIVSALLASSVLIVWVVESRPRKGNAPKNARKFLCWYAHLSGFLLCAAVVLAFLAEAEMLTHNWAEWLADGGADWWCPFRASLWFLAWSAIYLTLSTRGFKEVHDWRLVFGVILTGIAFVVSLASFLNGLTDSSFVKKNQNENWEGSTLLAKETLADGSEVLKMTIGNDGGFVIVYERVDKDTLKPIPIPTGQVGFRVRKLSSDPFGGTYLRKCKVVESWYTYHNGYPRPHQKKVGEKLYIEVADLAMIPTRCDEETAFIGPPAPETTGD